MKLIQFLEETRSKSEPLFYFGIACLTFSLVCLIMVKVSNTQLLGISSWIKPFKFAVSIGIFSLSMAWYNYYLSSSFNKSYYEWTVIILLAYELIYIAIQGARGLPSHYNLSSPLFATFFYLMAVAATIVTLYTAVVTVLFFGSKFPDLPDYYTWSVRFGLLIFVIFSFQGFLMGSRMAHTIGAPDGSPGIPLLNWSKIAGDARVAHFIGMHALQVLPILSFYVIRNTKGVVILSGLYFVLAIYTLFQALQGKPFIR